MLSHDLVIPLFEQGYFGNIPKINFEEKATLVVVLNEVSLKDVHDWQLLRFYVEVFVSFELDDRAVGDEIRLVDLEFKKLIFYES